MLSPVASRRELGDVYDLIEVERTASFDGLADDLNPEERFCYPTDSVVICPLGQIPTKDGKCILYIKPTPGLICALEEALTGKKPKNCKKGGKNKEPRPIACRGGTVANTDHTACVGSSKPLTSPGLLETTPGLGTRGPAGTGTPAGGGAKSGGAGIR